MIRKDDLMAKRDAKILDALMEYERLEVQALAEMFDVSSVTIRKDLDRLEAQGLIVRQHGYASLNENQDIAHRLAIHYDRKIKMAKKALDFVQDGQTILIESGSCCALLAKEIAMHKKNVTIITNSAFVADYIREYDASIILLAGEYQKQSQVMVGDLLAYSVQNFHVDALFFGIDGYDLNSGFTGCDLARGMAVRVLCAHAKKHIVISESEKFGKISLIRLCDHVDLVITDQNLEKKYKDELQTQGISLVQA